MPTHEARIAWDIPRTRAPSGAAQKGREDNALDMGARSLLAGGEHVR
jgi:hypothetical protein